MSGATFYSIANGYWSSPSTWSLTSGGTAGTAYPQVGDNVVIERNYTVTLNINQGYCNNFTLTSGSFILNTDNNNTSLTIGGNYSQTGGTFNFDNGTGPHYRQGILYLAGNFSNTVNSASNMTTSASTQYSNEHNGQLIFNGTNTQTVSFTNPNATQWVDFSINAGSSVQLLSNLALYDDGYSYNGNAIFTLNGTLDVGT